MSTSVMSFPAGSHVGVALTSIDEVRISGYLEPSFNETNFLFWVEGSVFSVGVC